VALLRGINVGGKNIVKMSHLRTCFECIGLTNVTTYIQSGNVLFETAVKSIEKLSNAIELEMSERLRLKGIQVAVVVSHQQLANVVEKAPPGFGTEPQKYRYDVIFLRAPASAPDLLPAVALNPAVDQVFEANGVLYFQRLTERASESRLARITATNGYRSMTIRNWNTTVKLYQLLSNTPGV
jgi:uncharacterized protein (DUF1697 family)